MITVTVSVYALGKKLGPGAAVAEVHRQIATPDARSLPCVHVINHLRELDEVGLRIDSGGTHLGKVRSRHFHEARTQAAQAGAHWVSVDDDVQCDRQTLEGLVAAIETSRGACTAPCWVRGGDRIDAVFVPGGITRVFGQHQAQPVLMGGMGLFAMHREAVLLMAEQSTHLEYSDDDGVKRLAVFVDHLAGGRWLGEDLAFYARLPSRIRVEGLTTACTVHAGQALNMRAERWRSALG